MKYLGVSWGGWFSKSIILISINYSNEDKAEEAYNVIQEMVWRPQSWRRKVYITEKVE